MTVSSAQLASSSRRCVACGTGKLEPTNVCGMAFSYRDERALVADASLILPVCTCCGETRLDAEQTDALDAVLERAYVRKRHADAATIIGRLLETGLSQVDVERVLGLSRGYISKVRRGERTVSGSTLRELVMLAAYPRENLRALAELDPGIHVLEEKLARATPSTHA